MVGALGFHGEGNNLVVKKTNLSLNLSMVSTIQTDGAVQMEFDRIFQLIDSVLPFEACLFHQVLPLSLEGSMFKLGIVDPQDQSALDYVRRILAYMNWSVVTQQISSEYQQSLLSAYLAYSNQQKAPTSSPQKPLETPLNLKKTPDEKPLPVNSSVQKLVEKYSSSVSTIPQNIQHSSPPTAPTKTPSQTIVNPPSKFLLKDLVPDSNNVPPLDLPLNYLYAPIEELANLPPKQLLQELLGRVLLEGIGRLYFERQASYGRVICSQDGVLKSVIPDLNLNLFQSLINELKIFAKLPLIPVDTPKQVEIDRFYRRNYVLLRVRVMQGNYGEEGTLQVLRGAALRFYQQQQLSTLGQDAVRLAEQLQRKMNEIRDLAQETSTPVDALPALEQLLHKVEQQLSALKMQYNLQQLSVNPVNKSSRG